MTENKTPEELEQQIDDWEFGTLTGAMQRYISTLRRHYEEQIKERDRLPDVTLKIWFAPHGIQADVEAGGELTRSIVRDFTYEYEVRDLKVMIRSWIYAMINTFIKAM